MSATRRIAAACLALGLIASTAAPSYAESTAHKLRREKQRAARLDARARHQAALVSRSRQELAALDRQANAALAALQQARLAADAAHAESAAEQQRLRAAQQRTAEARARLDAVVTGAYTSMASGGALGTTLSLAQTGNPQTFIDGIQVLDELGKTESTVVEDLKVAEATQLHQEEVAAVAAAAAAAAEQHATAAKQRADALVAQQQRLLARQRSLLADTRTAAVAAHARTRALEHAIAVARARAAAIRRAEALAAAHGPIPTCSGGSISGYSNGNLPMSALCPLWEAPGQMLQARAAAAFDRMSQAFSRVFGEPLCVTSSYRTYEKQVELYATMPAGYAAVPGTSNHGWGLAVDLCGGIQVDNSPEHIWLLDHAAAYDWFHPAWAMPGGPGPHEPWHWEYAG